MAARTQNLFLGLLPDPSPAVGAALASQFPDPPADPDLPVPIRCKTIQSEGNIL